MIIEIVHELRLASGTNNKKKILHKHKDNKKWKKFLQYVYDPRKSYGVSAPKAFDFNKAVIDDHMFQNFDDFNDRKFTGGDAKRLAEMLSEIYGEIPRLILNRTLKCGISYTIINSVYPGLIFEFKTMKGASAPILEYPVASSTKFDGVKVFIVSRPDSLEFLTSAGTPFDIKSLRRECEYLTFGVYEGELIHGTGSQVTRPIISGKLNSLLAGTKKDISDYSYEIYDYVRLEEWDSKQGLDSFKTRQDNLESIFRMCFQDSSIVHRVLHVMLESDKEVEEMFNYHIENGFEGTMHRYLEDPYMWTGDKRTDRLIKKKAIIQTTLKCIKTIPHSNPAKGITGSLVCEGYAKSGEFVTVNVGSGLSKSDILRGEEYFVGHDIEILYNSVTTTGSNHSLFLPRFKRRVGDL